MTRTVHDPQAGQIDSVPRWRRALRHPLARMLAASLVIFLALALSFAVTEALLPRNMSIPWLNAVAALACTLECTALRFHCPFRSSRFHCSGIRGWMATPHTAGFAGAFERSVERRPVRTEIGRAHV